LLAAAVVERKVVKEVLQAQAEAKVVVVAERVTLEVLTQAAAEAAEV
tara:strand:- start:163 stop:303 length:141 start_codon:yes stop_codon:yes gene_type:complete